MAGRGHSLPDTDSSSVESPSVGCGRAGLGRMPTASDCQWGARNEPADWRRVAQTPKSQNPEKGIEKGILESGVSTRRRPAAASPGAPPRAADFPLGFPHSIAVLRS